MRRKLSSNNESEHHWEMEKKKPRLIIKKFPSTNIEHRDSSGQDFCKIQIIDLPNHSMNIMESSDFSVSLTEELPSSKPTENEKNTGRLKELVCLLLKKQHDLDQGITELDTKLNNKIDSIAKNIPIFKENSCSETEFLSYFPLNSIENFDTVNELLCDQQKANTLGELLCSASGPTVRKCVNGMMKLLFKDSLCIDVGLTIQNRKRGFQNTNLMKCLYNAMVTRRADLTLKELHFCVSDWFRRYKDRLYGKIRPSQFKNRETDNIILSTIKGCQERLHDTDPQIQLESDSKNTVDQNLLLGEKSKECAEDSNAPIDISSPKCSLNGSKTNSTLKGSSQSHGYKSADKEKTETCHLESSICSHHASFIEEKAKVYRLEKQVSQLMDFVNFLKEENLSQKKEISRLKDKVKYVENFKQESLEISMLDFEEDSVL